MGKLLHDMDCWDEVGTKDYWIPVGPWEDDRASLLPPSPRLTDLLTSADYGCSEREGSIRRRAHAAELLADAKFRAAAVGDAGIF